MINLIKMAEIKKTFWEFFYHIDFICSILPKLYIMDLKLAYTN